MTALLVAACGGETPMMMPPPVGSECTSIAQCGAGRPNHIDVQFCEHCFARPDTHLCEAGKCRALDGSGTLRFGFSVPSAARGAKSFSAASLNPIRADGVQLTCASVLADAEYKNNPKYNAGNSNFKSLNPPGDPALAYQSSISADVGAGRLLVVRVTSEAQGRGTVMASGCAEGITVTAGQSTDVDITIR